MASSRDAIILAHGVIGSLAFVVIFPLGAIFMRRLSSPTTVYIHAAIQITGLALFTINFGTGVWLGLTSGYRRKFHYYHPYIGVLLFSLMWCQPLEGLVHHHLFKRTRKRTLPTHIHIWFGRALITLGMLNGGLGLMFAGNASAAQHVVYGVVAGVVWVAYMGTAIHGEFMRRKHAPVRVEEEEEKAEGVVLETKGAAEL